MKKNEFVVDINCDLGESFGIYKMGMDEEVLKKISSANIACGFHAGDPIVMCKTVQLARDNEVAVGAHPGYPDLQGFGRRELKASYEEVKDYIVYQLGALDAFARTLGTRLVHVKPHGAMYNMAAANSEIADAICEGVKSFNPKLIVVGLYGGQLIRSAKKFGLKSANEVFADRAYNDDGSLVSRREKGAVIHDVDLAIDRVVRMVKEGRVESINGKDIEIEADTICVHGDNESALDFVQAIRERFEKEGIEIVPMENVVEIK